MKIEEYLPSELLRPFIKSYKIIESNDELVNRVIPNTSFAIAFRLSGQTFYNNEMDKIALSPTLFSGLRKTVRNINYAPKTASLIVLFQETGASAFFKQPLHELFEESVSLDHFFAPLEISIVEERLALAKNNTTKIAVIEQYFSLKLQNIKPDFLVQNAITTIHTNNGTMRINKLAESLFISQDAFEKRFRKAVGASPKQFSSIVKMNAIISKNTESASFLDMAFENGFYDQAHFNKDFKLFTGQTPTDFFKSELYW
ncbi:helix-turn-helix domain-containing protein [Flavobacterium poyangense]|uniref:helix-turn-helix domain-containing protein n=1 Tax=Flavobacterium poyangense TaxID=2204302 RepID=UPI00141ECF59|nr:helix-turn-helix domain-containing protein [Flavobacterium sp. JXAS1]